MRKLKIFEHISLDGVIQASADENNFPYGGGSAFCRGYSGTRIRARQHEGYADRHRYQFLQARWAFEEPTIRSSAMRVRPM